MSRHLYVYYRVPVPAAREAALLARRVMNVAGRFARRRALRKRPGAKNAMETWMEIYEEVDNPSALMAALQRAVARSGLDRLTGERHFEWFEDLCV